MSVPALVTVHHSPVAALVVAAVLLLQRTAVGTMVYYRGLGKTGQALVRVHRSQPSVMTTFALTGNTFLERAASEQMHRFLLIPGGVVANVLRIGAVNRC